MSLANRKSLKALLAGVMALGAVVVADAAHAQAVVIRSSGPSAGAYPQGRKLPAGATVSLRAGDSVTVVDKAGSRVLSGPGNYTLNSQVNRDGGTQLSGLMSRGGGARSRTGAVRGAGTAPAPEGPASPDSVWYIDVSKGGTYCVADPAALVLWRPNREEEGTGRLLAADGTLADVTWKRGNALKLWPSTTLPVVDGQSYSFSHPVGPMVKITTRLLSSVPSDEVEVTALLAEKGCTAQLDLIAAKAVADTAAGS